jgi:hypothetical protein
MPNRLIYPEDNVTTENGGLILWKEGVFKEGEALKVGFLCAARETLGLMCPGRGEVLARRALARGQRFRSLHDSCYRKIMGTPDVSRFVSVVKGGAFRSHELPLPKGSKVLYHTREPGRSYMVAFQCRGCFRPERNNLKFIHDSTLSLYIRGRTNWEELCSDCVRRGGSHNRIRGWRTAPSGTRAFFPDDINAPVRVVYATCKCERQVKRGNAINNYDELTAVCQWHQRRPLELLGLLESLGSIKTTNSGAMGGRPKEAPTRRRKVVKAIASEWELLENSGKTRDDISGRLSRTTQLDLAPSLGIDISGDYASVNKRVSKWFEVCRLKEVFPNEKYPFKRFLMYVVDKLVHGSTVENISAELESRRDAGSAAA